MLSAVAALYDVHGNLPALDAVLAELDRTPILVGGDVAVGPWPAETLERLRGLGDRVRFIRGNADREVGESPKPVAREDRRLRSSTSSASSCPQSRWSSSAGCRSPNPSTSPGSGRCCSATRRHGATTRFSRASARTSAGGALCPWCVSASSSAVTRTSSSIGVVGDLRVVNAGSVGMPYEHEPGAYWAMLGPEVELRRTPYDPPDIAASGWPEEWPSATPEDATEYFERISREHA